jgi:hypothetical protein
LNPPRGKPRGIFTVRIKSIFSSLANPAASDVECTRYRGSWVAIQRYQAADWDDLLALWRHFNLHLARVIRTVDVQCIDHIWVIDEDTTITLGELMTDYLRHLKDHLQHIKNLIGNMT